MSLGAALRDCDLVFCASSMPIRDAESFLAASKRDVLFLSNRGRERNRRNRVVGGGRR